ncbi:DUF262 domain-containing protein [Ruegeria arenilitoris]|uniref:DUF262 domain-containing protein n=1 Tax=Ruegeria arenilitoris TaxID=1173585 RepID=UPI00147CF747|nr:DUF262 domain-containing protein [Ruegeria arenilitoris]
MASVPQTYTISDFIEWYGKKQLMLDPDFQRGSVWSPAAKVFLIDTILNDLPLPQIYFRTKVDPVQQTTVREVVDGQQRLRAILEFAAGRLQLTSKAPNFKGKTYETLETEQKEHFLSYKVPVVQLLNASDADVLEVFARLNSYSVKVTPAELRHAEYSEPVKWAIYDTTRRWSALWDKYKVVSVRDSVRLKNTSVVAELFMIVENGIGDGGESSISKYYRERKSAKEEHFGPICRVIDEIVSEIVDVLGEDFVDTTFFDAPNFIALFAACAFLKGQSPETTATQEVSAFRGTGIDWQSAKTNLAQIAQAFDEEDDEGGMYHRFVSATRSSTHRVSSRKPRVSILVEAIRQQ